jgi:hypothetical protein
MRLKRVQILGESFHDGLKGGRGGFYHAPVECLEGVLCLKG